MRKRVIRLASLLMLTLFSPMLASGQVSVLTQHNDNARTGQNLSETILNTSNVNQSGFGKLFWRTVDGFIYAQPLYIPGLTIQGATHNVVYVATEHNSVYAFDADDPNAAAPLWQVNLGTPVPSQDICIISGDTNPADCPYYDISPEIGITSTPAIDPVAGIIYVVSRTKNTSNSTYHDYLHALSLTTGAEQLGGPVEITGQVVGTGTGSSGGVVAFQAAYQHQRPALLLVNGVLYLAFGSVGDIGSVYHGWVMSYNASTLQQDAIFNVTPDGDDGGIWSAGQGPVADSSGNIYLMTGNGDFNANTQGGRDYGDSFIKFGGSSLAVSDYFTPDTQATLNVDNTDLGSGGPMLMPGTSLLVGLGKDGIMRVVNSTNMGHYSSTTNNDVQEFTATPNAFFSSPIYWNSPNFGPVIYIWSGGDYLKAFQFKGSTFGTTPVSQGTTQNSSGDPNAAALSISANGSMMGSGILWSTGSISQWAKGTQVPGIVRAYDATNLTDELWDSTQNLARDDVGNSAKFNPPTISNGRVYVGSFSGQLQVYGLNPPAFQGVQFVQVASATPQSAQTTVSVAYTRAQTAGDLNVVIVGWNDTTAAVQSVTDSSGNTYTLALGPTKGTGLSESIYYAKNILAGGANTVTVTFNQGATKPDIRILEYSGVATSSPLDVSTGASGNTYIADSGYVNTNAANELIVGASMVQSNTTVMAGAPFTPRVITSPNSDLAADRLVNVPGSYHSWEPLNAAGNWVMQVVTFKSATTSTVPFVSSVTPNTGPLSGGTAVTITGTNFAAGAAVTFGGVAATNVAVVNSATITATTPAGSAGAATVTVTVNGQSGSLASAFTYIAPPTVTNVSPNSGPTSGGTAVTITGTNFATGALVTFGSTAATSVTVVNSTTITATTPVASAGAASVTVTNSGGQNGSLANAFTYIVEPTVTSVSPNSGPVAGGTSVTITGTNFATGATVTFGSTAATNVAVVNNTTITATSPAGSAGPATVTVTVNGQSGSLTSGFTYIGKPTVTSVSPNNGSVAGGTAVTITGTNFATGATVTFGSTAGTSVTVVSSTTITATTPAGSVGAVTVTVTNLGSQSGSLTNGYTYITSVAISFAQVASATPQTASATVPVTFPGAQTSGDMNVVVVGWNDTTSTVQWVKDSAGNTYSLAIGPTTGTGLRQSIYYAANVAAGSNTVTVTFSQAAAYPDVRILEYRGVNALDVTAGASGSSTSANSGAATTTSANELIFGADLVSTLTGAAGSGFTSRIITSPDGDIAEDKVVTTAGSNSATATLNGSGPWIMQMVTFSAGSAPAPTVSSVSPNSGSTSGGTAVTITGTNFAAGATVTFGATAAASVTVVNSTTITTTTPAGSAGAATVTVTSTGGQSGNLASAFTYVAPPTVSSVLPNGGPLAGGTAVTITGTNFAAGATVTFGSTAATGVTVVNSTTITATTPSESAGAVTVTVTNSNGLSGSVANGFIFAPAPTVTGVSPNSGPTAGGTAITITGTNFAAGATVEILETRRQATNVVVVNSTTITAVTPTGDVGAVTVTVAVNGQSGNLANGFTYVVSPTVSSVSPNSGSTSGGTAVTITGTNFATGATVTFGSTAATNVAVVNSTTITATTPAGSAGTATVAVTANGQSGSLAGAFTYTTPPTVSGVSPSTGSTSGGTAVTITGTNFATGATVTFGSTAATNVTVVNSTTITATTPAGSAGSTTVTATNSGGQSGSLASAFTYVVLPTVSSVAPNSGPVAGGTAVTITGTNFATGATVTFGSTAATNVTMVNSTTITATTPAGSAGATTVTVTVNGQSGSLTSAFTYIPPPTVSSVSPNSGPLAGGTAVTITGTNFAAGATVTFGSTAATNVTVVNSTSITATTPVGSAGVVTVTVTNSSGQTGSLTSAFTYIAPPTVTSVTPNSGSTSGGTAVTITGTNFAAGATVTFGSTAATSVTVVNSTTITATTPAGSAGAVTVTVTNSGGQSGSLANGYTYVLKPTVTSVSPNSGPVAGGTSVTITGTNFAAGATVTFGSTAATNVAVVNSTTITATSPVGSAGPATVTVTVNGQSGSLTSGFTYIGKPTVTSVSPNNGPGTGGTAVTITGTNFATGATVTFGSTAATSVTVVSSTSITATTPAGSVGAVTVTITNLGSQSGSLANGFTYNASVAISFAQVASATPQSASATVPVSFPGAQTAGDLNVVVVGWNDTTSTVQSVKDSAGNTYSLAIGPTTGTGLRQSIYYSPNIAAGTNTVTVTFSQAAAYPDVRILEYRGVTTLDVKAGASGSSTSANSGAATTTSANELIFGADLVSTLTGAAGSGFTSRIITKPDGDIAEDKIVTTAGSNSATATLNGSGPWIMQMVTFAPGSTPTPTVTGVSPNSGSTSGGTAVTITGTNFAGGAAVTFGSTAATSVTVVNSTTISATTPAGNAGAVTVTVTNSGVQNGSLSGGFTYIVSPTVSNVSPSSGLLMGGTAVTITGTNFAAGATVTFGSTAATSVTVVNSTSITATTPAGSVGAATVTVTNSGGQSGSLSGGFTYIGQPTVTVVSPNSGSTSGGTAVTITGTNFAAGATVTFGSAAATNVVLVNSAAITATTPAGSAGAVTVTVTNSGNQSGNLASGFTYVSGLATYTDNFVRANGPLGASWSEPQLNSPNCCNALQIVNNQVFATAVNVLHPAALYTAGTFGNNQYSSFVVAGGASSNGGQAAFLRGSTTSQQFYNDAVYITSSAFTYRVGDALSNDFCDTGASGIQLTGYTAGDLHELDVAGTGPTFFWSQHNGVVDATCMENTDNYSGGFPGLGMSDDVNSIPTLADGAWSGGTLPGFSPTPTDNFVRANAGWLGVNWWMWLSGSGPRSYFKLSSNSAILTTSGGNALAAWTTALSGNMSKITVGNLAGGSDWLGGITRVTLPTGFGIGGSYYLLTVQANGTVDLFEVQGASPTYNLLTSGTYSGGTITSAELDASGTNPVVLTIKINGSTFGSTFSDSTYKLTGTYVGIAGNGSQASTITGWTGS